MAQIGNIGKTFAEFNLELTIMNKDSIVLKLVTSNMDSKEDFETLHITSIEELRNLKYLLTQIEYIYTTLYETRK